MNELKTYEKDGGYEDENGCHWRTLTDFLQGHVLNLCCCGNPEDNLLLIHDLLMVHETQWNIRKDLSYDERFKLYEAHQEELKEFVCKRWDDFLYFFWYVMNQKNVMTHGGSIPGWVDDDNFMDALKKWKAEYDLQAM